MIGQLTIEHYNTLMGLAGIVSAGLIWSIWGRF